MIKRDCAYLLVQKIKSNFEIGLSTKLLNAMFLSNANYYHFI